MSRKKWIYIGCGGCFGVTILGGILVAFIAYTISEMFSQFPESIQEMEQEHEALVQDYPFELNIEGYLEPERVDLFFNARDATIISADKHLNWLLQLGEEPMPMHKMGSFSVFRNIFESISRFPRVGVDRAHALREHKMNLNEYEHITRILSAEMVSWREMEEGSQYRKIADAYFQPLVNFEENLNAYKSNRPWHGINDNDEFSLESFVDKVKSDMDEAKKNREIFIERAGRITSASSAVFVDLWTNQFE